MQVFLVLYILCYVIVFEPQTYLRSPPHRVYLSATRFAGGDGIIDIDCGCGNRNAAHRRLACLRLDDMAEFYVGNADTEMCRRKMRVS